MEGEPREEPGTGAGAGAEEMLRETMARYRELVASGPGLIAEMVRGETLEEIDESARAARHAYEEITRQVAQSYERTVPPANPSRSGSNLGAEALAPEAKIALGLRKAGRTP